jgi:hypothetical protein
MVSQTGEKKSGVQLIESLSFGQEIKATQCSGNMCEMARIMRITERPHDLDVLHHIAMDVSEFLSMRMNNSGKTKFEH